MCLREWALPFNRDHLGGPSATLIPLLGSDTSVLCFAVWQDMVLLFLVADPLASAVVAV